MTFLERLKDITTITMTLFAVIDIIGSVPIILELKRKSGEIQAGKAAIVSGVIMILFVFFGEGMLKFIGINVSSFAVAGALIILFFAMEMILGLPSPLSPGPEALPRYCPCARSTP